jgi:hypothetical protein
MEEEQDHDRDERALRREVGDLIIPDTRLIYPYIPLHLIVDEKLGVLGVS